MRTTASGFPATRRLLLQGAGLVALFGIGHMPFGAAPARAAANDKYPEDAFKQKSDADAIYALYGKSAEASDKVKLDAPEIAENGAVVPVSVATTLDNVTSIAFFVSENPNALAASPRGFRQGPCQAWPIGSRCRRPAMSSRLWKPAASSTAPPRKSRSPSAAAAAEPGTLRECSDGIDHSRARHLERRYHRSPGADPASDGFRLRQGRARRRHPCAFRPGTDVRR